MSTRKKEFVIQSTNQLHSECLCSQANRDIDTTVARVDK